MSLSIQQSLTAQKLSLSHLNLQLLKSLVHEDAPPAPFVSILCQANNVRTVEKSKVLKQLKLCVVICIRIQTYFSSIHTYSVV